MPLPGSEDLKRRVGKDDIIDILALCQESSVVSDANPKAVSYYTRPFQNLKRLKGGKDKSAGGLPQSSCFQTPSRCGTFTLAIKDHGGVSLAVLIESHTFDSLGLIRTSENWTQSKA